MRGQLIAFIFFVIAAALPAQQPKISDTQLKVDSVTRSLAATVADVSRAGNPIWIGYEVPALPGSHLPACSNGSDASPEDEGCCGEYRLEKDGGTHNRHDDQTAQGVYVLLRFDHGDLVKVRSVAAGCHLNAGGVPFEWLTGVKAEESIAFLSELAAQPSSRSEVIDGALLAVSFHAAVEATRALEQMASSASLPRTREQAAFWLGVERGHDGFLALKSLEAKSTDSKFREKLAFDFAQNSDAGAEEELVHMAKFDPEAKVRGQALFWMAQKAGKRATQTLTDAIQNDPETDVKKKAVFALSQLPKDESVPQLIHVADTNTNVAVRKEAFFWLGQSQDARALAYLEQVLKR